MDRPAMYGPIIDRRCMDVKRPWGRFSISPDFASSGANRMRRVRSSACQWKEGFETSRLETCSTTGERPSVEPEVRAGSGRRSFPFRPVHMNVQKQQHRLNELDEQRTDHVQEFRVHRLVSRRSGSVRITLAGFGHRTWDMNDNGSPTVWITRIGESSSRFGVSDRGADFQSASRCRRCRSESRLPTRRITT